MCQPVSQPVRVLPVGLSLWQPACSPACGMKVHWWSCVLALLCMPAEVILSTWTVSQDPPSIPLMSVNSSAEITCSSSLSTPTGLNLYRHFHGNKQIVFLLLTNGQVTKNTTAAEFVGRIHVAPNQQTRQGYGFTLRLSLLGPEDTDLYYCSWSYLNSKMLNLGSLRSNGTIIIVREGDPQEQCKYHTWELTCIALSVTAFAVVLVLFTVALNVRCKRFKKHFRPAGPQHVCPQQTAQHCPYLITSADALDFRGIL